MTDTETTLRARITELEALVAAQTTIIDAVADAPLKVDILKSQQDHLLAQNAALRKALDDCKRSVWRLREEQS